MLGVHGYIDQRYPFLKKNALCEYCDDCMLVFFNFVDNKNVCFIRLTKVKCFSLFAVQQDDTQLIQSLLPEGNSESSIREHDGLLVSLSFFYVIEEPNSGLQKYPATPDFLEVTKTFIPRRESAKTLALGSNLFLLILIKPGQVTILRFQLWNRNSPKQKGKKPLLCG